MPSENSKRVGTLAPISCLMSKAGETGTFYTAIEFCRWLAKTGQNAWQLLPLHQTHLEPNSNSIRVPSPYKGYGVGLNPTLYSKKLSSSYPKSFKKDFISSHTWLENYCLFSALSEKFGTDNWTAWPKNENNSVNDLKDRIEFYKDQQLVLHFQLHQLKQVANRLKILLIGDIPFYLPLQSPLVWSNQSCFDLDSHGMPHRVSGLPDGPKAHFGRQVWGHPLYHWQNQSKKANILKLFKLRLLYLSTLIDLTRLDHAKGFYHYGSMGRRDNHDQILKGPGTPVLLDLIKFCRDNRIELFAEDSGDRLVILKQTLRSQNLPGVRVFRFALTTKNQTAIHPEYALLSEYPHNSVAYTTTHDTEPLMVYLKNLTKANLQLLLKTTDVRAGKNLKEVARNICSAIINCPSKLTILPIQDWLLTTDRINVPGTEKTLNDPNWRYRLVIPVENLPQIL